MNIQIVKVTGDKTKINEALKADLAAVIKYNRVGKRNKMASGIIAVDKVDEEDAEYLGFTHTVLWRKVFIGFKVTA